MQCCSNEIFFVPKHGFDMKSKGEIVFGSFSCSPNIEIPCKLFQFQQKLVKLHNLRKLDKTLSKIFEKKASWKNTCKGNIDILKKKLVCFTFFFYPRSPFSDILSEFGEIKSRGSENVIIFFMFILTFQSQLKK